MAASVSRIDGGPQCEDARRIVYVWKRTSIWAPARSSGSNIISRIDAIVRFSERLTPQKHTATRKGWRVSSFRDGRSGLIMHAEQVTGDVQHEGRFGPQPHRRRGSFA